MKRITILCVVTIVTLNGCGKGRKERHAAHQKMIQQQNITKAHAATELYQQGEYAKSKYAFEQILRQKDLLPHFRAEVRNNYACVLNQLGYRSAAHKIWTQLTQDQHYTTKEVAWFNIGLLTTDTHKAITYFSRAIKLNPSYVDALFFQAQAYVDCNQPRQARQNLKKIVSLAPEHRAAQTLLKKIPA